VFCSETSNTEKEKKKISFGFVFFLKVNFSRVSSLSCHKFRVWLCSSLWGQGREVRGWGKKGCLLAATLPPRVRLKFMKLWLMSWEPRITKIP